MRIAALAAAAHSTTARVDRPENDPTGPIRPRTVEETFTRSSQTLQLIFNSYTIETTAEHPFYVQDKGWTSAGDLTVGDLLVTDQDLPVQVQQITPVEETNAVYNMRVAEDHTYFVGEESWDAAVWAHNVYNPETGEGAEEGPLLPGQSRFNGVIVPTIQQSLPSSAPAPASVTAILPASAKTAADAALESAALEFAEASLEVNKIHEKIGKLADFEGDKWKELTFGEMADYVESGAATKINEVVWIPHTGVQRVLKIGNRKILYDSQVSKKTNGKYNRSNPRFWWERAGVFPATVSDDALAQISQIKASMFRAQLTEVGISLLPGGSSATHIADGEYVWAGVAFVQDVAEWVFVVAKIGRLATVGKAINGVSKLQIFKLGKFSKLATFAKNANKLNPRYVSLGMSLTEGAIAVINSGGAIKDFYDGKWTSGSIKALDAFFSAIGAKAHLNEYIAARKRLAKATEALEKAQEAVSAVGAAGRKSDLELAHPHQLDFMEGYLNSCFVAGTPIRTPSGAKPIESIQVGDEVLSRNEANVEAEVGPQVVEELFEREAEVIEVVVNGRAISTTAEHPFFTADNGWTPAGELEVGDKLASESSDWLEVQSIKASGKLTTVYNVRVAQWHTYFVGEESWGWSVWVHNTYSIGKDANGADVLLKDGKLFGYIEKLEDGTINWVHPNTRALIGKFANTKGMIGQLNAARSRVVTDAGTFLDRVPPGNRPILDDVLGRSDFDLVLPKAIRGEIRGVTDIARLAGSKANVQAVRSANVADILRNHPGILSRKFGLNDLKLVATAKRRGVPIITTNARLKGQITGTADRLALFGNVKILVAGVDFTDAASLRAALKALGY